MKQFLSILLVFEILNTLCSEGLNENERGTVSLAVALTAENQPDAQDETENSKLSLNDLSTLHNLTKTISHAKGIYREGGHEKKVRRSIVRKATVFSESAFMKELLLTFESADDKLLILEQMEDLVHQYDVAVAFATMGGMKMISPLLFSNDDEIVSSVALVLGSAMQSNPVVQKLALDQNIGRKLLHLLTHKSPYVMSRIVFAISSLLRNAPEAQEEFLLENGVSKLADILKNSFMTTTTKLKIINLFNDLAVEQRTAKHDQKNRNAEQINAFQRSFATEILNHHICVYIVMLLELEDYDSHQRIVDAMLSLDGVCHEYFKINAVKNRLKHLLEVYYPVKYEPWYPDIDEELRSSLYDGLMLLYINLYDGTNGSPYKYYIKSEL